MDDQNKKKSGMANVAWCVETLFLMKECGMTFLGKEERVTSHADTRFLLQKRMPIEAIWRRAVQHLDGYPHDDDKIWQMALAKIKEVSPEEIKTIKNNPPKPLELN
ncbi:hypothetical protein G9A89_003209 [Geosiphon pyriformis]|nr:hypothetical protein G9A89_003209 [Geosiphon pyriformis]